MSNNSTACQVHDVRLRNIEDNMSLMRTDFKDNVLEIKKDVRELQKDVKVAIYDLRKVLEGPEGIVARQRATEQSLSRLWKILPLVSTVIGIIVAVEKLF